MRALCVSIAAVVILSGQATAQATTAIEVAAFPSSATNPATAMPLATPVIYPIASVACNQAKVAETLPIVNPNEGRYDDPANPTTRDCALALDAQFRALPLGSGLKAAYRFRSGATPGTWSPFSTAFAVTAPQTHPCDGTPPSAGTVLEGTRTLSWCWDGLDANGAPTTATAWTATVDGARVTLTNVQVGATANAQGKRLYAASLALLRGTRAVRVAGTNAVGEGVFSAVFTITVTVPAAAPSVAEIRGIS